MGAAAVSGGALFVVYLLTLAPTVTLWDSGEFLAAAHSLGVPHPPGTPLFIYTARAWATALGWLPFDVAVNLASAAAAAGGAAILAWLLTRWTGRPAAGIAGALIGGTMAAVWQNATETEVYAHSALAVSLALVSAEHAGTRWSTRHRVLLAFVFGLAVPLHISVLVAGPAVILLSATDRGGGISIRAALLPASAWVLAAGLGTVSLGPVVVGVLLAIAAAALPAGSDQWKRLERGHGWWSGYALPHTWRPSLLAIVATLLGASFVMVMLVRAPHDPTVNAGNPESWSALVEVVGRSQYDVPPLWPRRAPFWLQVGNFIQYSDWQVALGTSDAPGISPWRTPFTLVFVALGVVGAAWHRRHDRRGWNVLALLLLCASLGVVVVLNLRAGPSFGWGVLADGALREARERDYFFALAFLIAGLWCGCGLVALRDRWRSPLARGIWIVAAVPMVLNWRAVDRRRLPDAALATEIARELLAPLPANAVLLLAGDHDTFPIWFAQEVRGIRRDVTTVTIPLLGAGWYRAELARRHALIAPELVGPWIGLSAILGAIGESEGGRRRPIVAAASVSADDRRAVSPGRRWELQGMWYTTVDSGDGTAPLIDSTALKTVLAERASRRGIAPHGRVPDPWARDPAGRYVQRLLSCPMLAMQHLRNGSRGHVGLLESICNFR